MENKKGVINQLISVFILVLVIGAIVSMTFLFTNGLKGNVLDTSKKESISVANESGWINATGYDLATASELGFTNAVASLILNATNNQTIVAANYTLTSDGNLINATALTWNSVYISYTYDRTADPTSYYGVNDTEAAGATIVNYLPLLFIALIFGVILVIILKVVLPYLKLGEKFGGGF